MATESVLDDGPLSARRFSARSGDLRKTGLLARFAVETRFEDIPPEVVAATKRLILDEIAVTAAAFSTPVAKALIRQKGEQGGAPEATLMVDGRKLPASSVAYIHAQLANLLDADETLYNRMHTVSASVMAGLAMAEKLGSSGKELIAAIATGFDITARVGLSLQQFAPRDDGELSFSGVVGWGWMAFGAAATTGRLLELNVNQMSNAFGQAFVTTPINFDVQKHNSSLLTNESQANWHKYQVPGPSTEAGMNAALLASFGWVAQRDVLDEGSQFWRSFTAAACNWDTVYGGLGESWYISETSIKPYPFCRFGNASLDIMSDIVSHNDITADEIDEILLRAAPFELGEMLASTVDCNDPLKLMLSQPTAIALIALGVPPGPKWFETDLASEHVRSIARKVRYEMNPEWETVLVDQINDDGYFRRLPTEVVVRTKSGGEYRGYADCARGDPWDAGKAYGGREVADKARSYLAGIIPDARIESLIHAVENLEEASDVSAMAKAMCA